ncbi:NAD+ synthase [Candidatus Bathyarchaeota archaeon]|nr:NAD+ synthase [Candidatus Bathyarchaeota archaeon]TET63333.1 MAG: NAD+ synthase [Candidatus Bathyarchaeota archaeon]
MKLEPTVLNLDWFEVETRIKRFIKDYVEKSGAKGIVLGLSGGIDSCTTAALSALAIGGNRIDGLMLPEQETQNIKDIEHAKLVAEKFGFKTVMIDITSTLESFYTSIPIFKPTQKLCKGNIKARTRMIYIYYYANRLNLLVCGASDKSEAMTGYFTKWGDIAADISPLMDLYKTQVRKLAHHIGLPKEIVAKPASPTLWPGQLAEEELGMEYGTLDLILYGLEHFMKIDEIARQLGVRKELVNDTKRRCMFMEHKRRMPLTTKIQYRTVGADFRFPKTLH